VLGRGRSSASGKWPRGREGVELVLVALAIACSGLIVGGLARFAVPGPDPLSIWKTILLGIAGSLVGGFVASLFVDPQDASGDMLMSLLFSVGGAVVLLILYRRFVQGRPITGPEAQRPPDRRV
jgi:uncharacterized membrane protein YeaQ/YmgE (transglycosylase-associated protein family)